VARDPTDPEDMAVEHREKLALVGELLADASHELNNQLAFVLSNLQNLAEYGDDLSRVVGAYRERLAATGIKDPALSKLEAEVDLDFLLDDAGRAARDGVAGATRLRDVLRVLSRLTEDEPADRPLIDLAKAVRQVLAVEAKAIGLRAQLDAEVDVDGTIAAPPALVTRAVAVALKDALGAFDPQERDSNRLGVRVERRPNALAVVVERTGGRPEGRGLALAAHAMRTMGAELVVEPRKTTLVFEEP
jgi:two-component system, NtrC family, sensor kinase